MNNITSIAYAVALFFYTAAFWLLWRHLNTRLQQAHEPTQSVAPNAVSSYAVLAAFAGLSAQLVVVTNALVQHTPDTTLTLSFLGVSNLVTCVMVGVIALSAIRVRADNLLLLCLPIAAASVVALALLPQGRTQPISLESVQIGHILMSISAYAALMTAALQSVLIGVQERRLRSPRSGLLGILPPLESMEDLFITMLWLGLGLLTLSIATGVLYLQNMFDQRLVHHTVLTTLSWLVYASFMTGHHLFGWRGVTGVRWNLAAFALLLLGYLGSKFVLEYLL